MKQIQELLVETQGRQFLSGLGSPRLLLERGWGSHDCNVLRYAGM